MKDIEYDPIKNKNAISIIRQEDGNYIGYIYKFDKLIAVRDYDPNVVLTRLLTHNGK